MRKTGLAVENPRVDEFEAWLRQNPSPVGDDPPGESPAERRNDSVPGSAPPLEGKALISEVCRLIRAARVHWDAHHNAATRLIRSRAMRLYERLTREEREEVPQVLRIWLRYRSEKYYGARKKKKRKPR